MIGEVIGDKYRIIARISEGGMGELYRASAVYSGGVERDVALKVIRARVQGEAEFEHMFVEEAKIATLLTHGNLVHVYDFGVHEGVLYLCMELVQGKDLGKILARVREDRGARLGVRYALHILEQIAEGLDYAHRKNDAEGRPLELVHRDVSHTNILVSFDGAVKLTDFGIARIRREVPLTHGGVIKGKLAYMSPEQASSGAVDRRSDIFSLGVVAWEALTGQRLFAGASDKERRDAVLHKVIPPPSEWNPDVPRELDEIVLRALERNPRARQQTARELAKALTELSVRCELMADGMELGRELRRLFPDDVPATALDLAGSTGVRRLPQLPPPPTASPSPVSETPVTPVTAPMFEPPSDITTSAVHQEPSIMEVPTLPDGPRIQALQPGAARSRRRAWAWGAAVAGIAAVAGAIGLGKRTSVSPPPKPPGIATPRTPTPSTVTSAEPIQPTSPTPTAAPKAAPTAATNPSGTGARTSPAGPRSAKASRPAQRPAKRAGAARKPGTLAVIDVRPWAEVFVDGVHRGWSPAPAISVPAGRHRVTLANSDAQIERTFTVNVPEDGRVVLRGDLRTLQP